jgi:hypothetical protein
MEVLLLVAMPGAEAVQLVVIPGAEVVTATPAVILVRRRAACMSY